MDVDALEAAALDRGLDRDAHAYYATGAGDELTLRANRAAWGHWRIRPRVLRDVGAVDTATTVLGTPVRAPVLVAPAAYQRLADDDGERAMARGAAAAGTVMTLSTMSTVSMEDVATAAPGSPRWFQLYVHVDRGDTERLVDRAEAAGYTALVVTVDTPELGQRARHGQGGFVLPPGLSVANLADTGGQSGRISDYAATTFDPSLTFEAIAWLVGRTSLPVVVKGVLRGDDAAAAVDAGAAAVCVSNHGGRQLDGAVATADALPDVVAGVAGRAEVYVDGGITRGTDVLRALALGARAVWIGRPALWGLATGGADGVRDVVQGLAEETRLAFALAGVRSVHDATPDLLVHQPWH
jgi:4-hydroxymandelate oxidase